jgi:hypothetical protein
MIELGTNHYQIVKDVLQGKKILDEQTLASIWILDGRLRELKRMDKIFSGVKFSRAVEKLLSEKESVMV